MGRGLLYIHNPAIGTVASGSVVPMGTVGNIVRRHGCAINLIDNGIRINESGYYTVAITINIVAAATTATTATLCQDGVPVSGAVSAKVTPAAAGDTITLIIPAAAVRVINNRTYSTLTVVLNGSAATDGTITALVDRG